MANSALGYAQKAKAREAFNLKEYCGCLMSLMPTKNVINKNESVSRSHSEEDKWALTVGGAVPPGERNGVCHLRIKLMDVGHHHVNDPL